MATRIVPALTEAGKVNEKHIPDRLAPEALSAAIETPPVPAISLLSTTDTHADTKRLRVTSSQKQEASNGYNGGEVAWFDLEDPRAKAMLTWRIRYDPLTRKPYAPGAAPESAPYMQTTWFGWHYYAQDQPDDNNPDVIHNHASLEFPDSQGKLQTRLQFLTGDRNDPSKIGADVILISTNRADFLVDRQTTPGGESGGRFILAGSHALERMVEFSRNDDKVGSRRWMVGVTAQTETGLNAGANWAIKRHGDDGALLGYLMYGRRSNGEITFGTDDWTPPSDPSRVMVKNDGGVQNGVFVYPVAPLTTGAAFKARLTTVDESAFQVRVGTGTERYNVSAGGKTSWGSGSAAPDTHLYRDAFARLKTDGELVVVSNVRTGAATGAGGVANVVVGNGTAPTSTSTSQFSMYSEAGVPKFATAKGTVKFDVQPAMANATDSTDVVATLNNLLLKIRTIGLIAS